MEKMLTVLGRTKGSINTATFTAEDCAKIGNYAAQNRVARGQKHFQQLNLSESTTCYTYVAKVPEHTKAEDSTEVTRRKAWKQGCAWLCTGF